MNSRPQGVPSFGLCNRSGGGSGHRYRTSGRCATWRGGHSSPSDSVNQRAADGPRGMSVPPVRHDQVERRSRPVHVPHGGEQVHQGEHLLRPEQSYRHHPGPPLPRDLRIYGERSGHSVCSGTGRGAAVPAGLSEPPSAPEPEPRAAAAPGAGRGAPDRQQHAAWRACWRRTTAPASRSCSTPSSPASRTRGMPPDGVGAPTTTAPTTRASTRACSILTSPRSATRSRWRSRAATKRFVAQSSSSTSAYRLCPIRTRPTTPAVEQLVSPVLPVVAGEAAPAEAARRARSEGVWQLLHGRVVAPDQVAAIGK